MTRHLNTSEARDNFGKVVDRVSKKGERVILSRRGKELAAIIPLEDLRAYEHIIEELEDRVDAEEAARILASSKPEDFIPWEKVKKDLGL